jgi:hypothetical protein
MNDKLTSSLVSNQVPSFIRDEYPLFVTFLQKYYEWMEQTGNVLYESEQIKNSYDVDLSSDYYIDQIKKEFLPYFPENIEVDKRTFLKFVSKFYATKGTPDSLKFLFRALFNEEIQIFFPKDDILKVSDGKWVLPLALRLDTTDNNIFNITNVIITGQNSKATALVESVTRSIDRQLGISYIEVYISNVQRLFETGEIVSATYNNGISDVTVTAKLIGSLSEIKIDPNNRGLFYRGYDPVLGYSGDPVTIVSGLNPESNTPVGAIAFVGDTTKGSVTDIIVVDGGFGFRDPRLDGLNTSIVDIKNGFTDTLFGTEAVAQISLVDSSVTRTVNVAKTLIEEIYTESLDDVGGTGNAQNTIISNISSYQSFNVHPISFVSIIGSGGGYRTRPDVEIYSLYNEENDDVLVISSSNIVKGTNFINDFSQDLSLSFETGDYVRIFLNQRFEDIRVVSSVDSNSIYFSSNFENNISGISVYKVLRNNLYNLGSLGRFEIIEGGENYEVGEYLVFSGGSGYGANAQISEVHSSNNGIKSVEFLQTNDYVIGGEGYTENNLPNISVNTVAGSNAVVNVTEVCGNGEQLSLTTSRIGSISSLRVTSFGYDYVGAPQISLRNADLVVSNVTTGLVFVSNTRIYQGSSNSLASFSAFVDTYNADTGFLRVFDYTGTINNSLLIKSDDDTVDAKLLSSTFYGDGKAKATASFENGLIRYPGLYLNTDGHLSEDRKIQDGVKYHNFSYVINTTKDYDTFKTTLDNIVHPIGTRTFVNKIYSHYSIFNNDIQNIIYKEEIYGDTFNISYSSNNMVSTNASANLSASISVGDVVILEDLEILLEGTSNTISDSNVIVGLSTNFLNQLQDGDLIVISTGNTEIVTSVESNTSIITQNTIGVSSNGSTINLIYNDTKTVTFVNANTILVNSNFESGGNNIVVIHRKVE